MARFKTSGDISLQELINFFGGGEKLTDFYRGGGLVPTTRSTPGYDYYDPSYGSWSATEWAPQGTPVPGNEYYAGSGNYFIWGSTRVHSDLSPNSGYQYEAVYDGRSFYLDDRGYVYPIRRRTVSYTHVVVPPSTENINLSIPSSGDIKLTDFYGAYNS